MLLLKISKKSPFIVRNFNINHTAYAIMKKLLQLETHTSQLVMDTKHM
jgi:hypothetical protein